MSGCISCKRFTKCPDADKLQACDDLEHGGYSVLMENLKYANKVGIIEARKKVGKNKKPRKGDKKKTKNGIRKL